MVKNYPLKRETSSLLLTKIVLVEEEQHGESYQVLRIRKKERYYLLFILLGLIITSFIKKSCFD